MIRLPKNLRNLKGNKYYRLWLITWLEQGVSGIHYLARNTREEARDAIRHIRSHNSTGNTPIYYNIRTKKVEVPVQLKEVVNFISINKGIISF